MRAGAERRKERNSEAAGRTEARDCELWGGGVKGRVSMVYHL